MGMQLFGLLTLLGMSTLAPVNYFAAVDRRIPSSPSSSPASNYSSSLGTGGPGDISINITNQELDFLYRITIQNVPPRSSWLSFHLLYLWVISIIGYACLIIYYRDYVNLKFQYQEHVLRKSRLSKIEMRSLMVYGIPRDLRNESALAAYFQSLGLGRVENVVICRKWSNLKKAVYQRAKYLMLLEEVFSKVMRLANRKRVFLFHRGRSGTPGSNVVGGINFSDSHTRNSTNNTTNPTTATTSTNALMLASSRFVAEDSSTDTSIFEIMSRLDAVDPKFRPKHRLGLLGLFGQQVCT